MRMHNPPHPGGIISEFCLPACAMTIQSAADHLGVSRKHLSPVIHGRVGISADLAIRLSQAFGSSPGTWLRMQASYDAWQAEQHTEIQIEPVPRVA